ncbi:helix-turn-helix transcriptional regulator [Methylobacterium sp. ID0610]|uniref:helix-turn-helix transcriptional regulator n=1 Tax=Methylobacterium carpenticola TaxID=3344827 RepID=UPI0036CF9CA1
MSIGQSRHEISSTAAPGGLIAALLLEARETLEIDRAAARRLALQAVAMLDGATASAPTGGLAPWQMRRVDAHIAENIGRTIALGHLAACAKLSASHFGRAFKTSFGETPHAYILRKRIERARRLMLETAAPLAAIALDCGMADQSHFSRVFRQFTGMSPHAWRRSMMPA